MQERWQNELRPRRLLKEAQSLASSQTFFGKVQTLIAGEAIETIEKKERAFENARLLNCLSYSHIDHVTALAVILVAERAKLSRASP